MANRLKEEQSPYLLQHAHNPVDWYPWGDEAFERAEQEHKPVIVSIGYAACHWCHVMERESFEDEATATYMNEHFINIKVDREEHPDVDHMYMDAVQAISRHGGWPLNVFVTPQRVPFYGGTYYPPKPMYGRPSWLQVLEQINKVWKEQPGEVQQQTEQMRHYLHQLSEVAVQGSSVWNAEVCRQVADNMLAAADTIYGGFGKAPKFPAAKAISYLLEHYHYTGYEPALQQALRSIDALINGGIYDQLGGGFARYSTDDKWLVPHFEKMLYDNALLVSTMSDAYAVTKNEKYYRAITETVDFVNRELRDSTGGFYCALDADSEGVEGKFYTWTWDEFMAATNASETAAFYFGVTHDGNWEEVNILHEAMTVQQVAMHKGLGEDEVTKQIAHAKQKLLAARSKRVRPATDDKCLLSWNALMNTALSKAGALLENDAYIRQAKEHMQWMLQAYTQGDELLHTWKNGKAKIAAKLDDYAYLAEALLQLAKVTGEQQYILKANELTDVVIRDFLHSNRSFFYYSSARQKDLPVRKTDLNDGATPSANSIMAQNLVILGLVTEDGAKTEQGTFMLHRMSAAAGRYATSFSAWAVAGQRLSAGYKTMVVTGSSAGKAIAELNSYMLPECFVVTNGDADQHLPVLAGKEKAGQLSVYTCDMDSCSPRANSVQDAVKRVDNAK